ncbi:helix-turn-helix domain-containing protein [Microbulbifer sp. ZKSA006]
MREFEGFHKSVSYGIKSVRRERGMTQEELAEAANISAEFVSRIERGVNKPSLKTLFLICSAMNVDLRLVLDGRDMTDFEKLPKSFSRSQYA